MTLVWIALALLGGAIALWFLGGAVGLLREEMAAGREVRERVAAALDVIQCRLKEINTTMGTFADRLKAIREAHEKEESDEATELAADKAELEKRAARIAELEQQVAQNTITPEGEAELEKLEGELGLTNPAPPPPA